MSTSLILEMLALMSNLVPDISAEVKAFRGATGTAAKAETLIPFLEELLQQLSATTPNGANGV